MATLIDINHNAGGAVTDFWDNETDPGGGISVTAAAGLNSTANGLQFDMSVTDEMKVDSTFTAPASNEIRFRMYFDPNGTVGLGANDLVSVGIQDSAVAGDLLVNIRIRNVAVGDNITVVVEYDDSSGFSIFPGITVSDAPHCIEISIIRESSSGAQDGVVKFWIDNIFQNQDVNVGNSTNWADLDEIFAIGNDEGVSGSTNLYIDEIFVTDVAIASLGCSPNDAMTISAMTKPADIDADGLFLYIAALNTSGFPTLVKFSSGLAADGTFAFDPGTGTDIGVQCGRFDADVVWIAGDFGSTNVVEKSENAGTSFTVKDTGSFGTVETFVIGPDSDERVLISDVTNDDIQETIDDGDNWTQINASVGFDINAIARLDTNVQETVFGNDLSATDNIDYSVNSGDDMEDFTTGDFPIVSDVTSVIVN